MCRFAFVQVSVVVHRTRDNLREILPNFQEKEQDHDDDDEEPLRTRPRQRTRSEEEDIVPNIARMNAKAWTPAVPRKAPDNIVSSSYTTTKVFVPSYEKERQPRIELLLANDYQRIWWQEKQIWDKKFADSLATRKILPRKLIKRKVPTCVTVKYPTRTERLKEKRETKQKPIENPDVSSVKSEERNEMKSDREEARTEGYDEKSERGEEPEQQEKHVEAQLENPQDTQVETDEDTQVEADQDTQVETGQETKIENSN